MAKNPNKALEVCDSRYQEIYGKYAGHSGKKVIMSHFGEFSQELVNSLSNQVEQAMLDSGDKKGTVKKIFSILIEGLQNIRLHGERDEKGDQTAFLVITQGEDEYHLTIGNLIRNENIDTLKKNLDKINEMDRGALKEYYMEVLTNGMISSKGGAGLGFITMAMKSSNPLHYEVEPINDELSVFTVESLIQRKKK